MRLVHIQDIVIPANRQRKEFPAKEMEDLKKSIATKGLLHPPVVRNDGVTLVAGERRLRAIRELYGEGYPLECDGKLVPPMQLPVNMLSDLPPLAVMEAELEENVVRLDLTWQDKAKAIQQLRDLRMAQAEAEDKPFTITELAEEIKGHTGSQTIQQSIVLAANLHIPEVAKAKSHKEAVKVLRKIKETEWRAELAAKVDLKEIEHDLRHGDLFDLTPLLPDAHFDLILADPPYGVDADEFGSMSDTGHNYKDSWEAAYEIYKFIATEGFRVTKAEAHCYIFCSIEHFHKISDAFDLAGWSVWPRPIIWNKGNGMLPRPEHGPRYTYECILFASKGDKRVLHVRSDVITVSGDKRLLHGAQKPVELYGDLISRSCLPGSRIFDPTGGSGTTISAAAKARCTVTLFELNEHNFNLCVGRLSEDPLVEIDLGIEEEEA